MDEIEWWEFDTPAELAEQVAGDIGFVIESAVEAHGGARIALPGDALLEPIAKALLKKNIAWPKVTIMPTDDRLAPAGDVLTNIAKLEKLFGAKGAQIVSLSGDESEAASAGKAADARLAELDWPLDLVCLGMNDEGHAAALLPGPDLDAALNGPKQRRAIGIRPEPSSADAPLARVTLTAAALTSARTAMVVVDGSGKRTVLERAIKDGPLSSVSIGRLIAAIDAPIDIFWSAE